MSEKISRSEPRGEPLLLLPGLMCDREIFRHQLAAFPQASIAADYSLLDSLEGMAAHVLQTAPRRFALLGHSMGARVALEVVRLARDRVSRLALLSTGIHPRSEGEAGKRHALRDIGRQSGMATLVDAWLPPMIAPANQADGALTQRLRAMCIAAGLARYEAQSEALLSRPEVEDLLPTIDCPVLVAVGSEDRWSPVAQHRAIAACFRDAELVVVAGAGHMLPAESPAALNAAIAGWLARPARSTI